MDYRAGELYCEDVRLAGIAEAEGTPCYVYSSAAVLERFDEYNRAFGAVPHRVCYAVKANSNLAILKLLAEAGSGFDIVSGGELYRVLAAGGDPAKVVFSGVGKTSPEIIAALEHRIHSFNCESETELALIDLLARERGVKARVALRVNPDVDATTHPYVSTGMREHKFGVDIAQAEAIYERAKRLGHIVLDGVSCHIGSQILETGPMMQAFDRMAALVERLRARGIPVRALDLGGGLGVAYQPDQNAPPIGDFIQAMLRKIAGLNLEVMIEPGRSIVAEAGALLTRVLYRKANGTKQFVIVDAAMNDLIRPALYQAHHEIVPLRSNAAARIIADIVGPVCESGDFLARGREIADVSAGDLLAILTAGAYGFVSSSNYNSRPRPPEILVERSSWRVVRRREEYADLIRGEG